MNYIRRVVSTAVLLFALEGLATAQEPAPLASVVTTGQRVRVRSTTEPRHVVGGVSAIDSEFLSVIPDGLSLVKLPMRSITTVDASRGHKRNWLKGLGFGAAAGVGLGFAFSVDAANCGPDTTNFCSRAEALTGGTVLFGGIGAVIGAFIKTERWTSLHEARPSQ